MNHRERTELIWSRIGSAEFAIDEEMQLIEQALIEVEREALCNAIEAIEDYDPTGFCGDRIRALIPGGKP